MDLWRLWTHLCVSGWLSVNPLDAIGILQIPMASKGLTVLHVVKGKSLPVKVTLDKVVYLLFSLGVEVLELVHGTVATERNRDRHHHI